MERLAIEVWSDIACPWCYVGKRRLETALAEFPDAEVAVVWRAFELDPSPPKQRSEPGGYAERLARKYGIDVARAQGMIEHMVGVGAAAGIRFDFTHIRPACTFDAHRLLSFAQGTNRQDCLKERLLHAYFSEGAALDDHETLATLAAASGLEHRAALEVLSSDSHSAQVRLDERIARELGVRGVPFFKIGKFGVSGAQPAELLAEVVERAIEDSQELGTEQAFPEGAVCVPGKRH